jgi:hypothetical protein
MRVRRGFRRGVAAHADNALALLADQEETAEPKKHWWLHDVIWCSADDESKVIYMVDFDGNDLLFQGWGPRAAGCLEAVRDLLAAHRT